MRPIMVTVLVLTVAGALAVLSLWIPYRHALSFELVLFVLMGCVSAGLNVKIPFVDAHVSVDTGFVFAILMIYGVLPGLAVEAVTKVVFTVPKVSRRTAYRVAFNVASGVVSAFAAGAAYRALLARVAPPALGYAAATLAMVLAYFLVNTFSVAAMLAIVERRAVLAVWRRDFAWTILGFLVSGSIATVLFCLNAQTQVLGIVMTVPLVAMAHFAHRLYLQAHEKAGA